MGVWRGWVNICAAINRFFSKLFYKWVGFVGAYPKSVICIALVLSLGLMAGFVRFNLQSQGERLYFSQSNTAVTNLDRSMSTFPAKFKPESVILTMTDGSSIFNAKVFRWALKLHKDILKTRLNEICGRYNSSDQSVNGCLTLEPLEFFNYDQNKITDQTILPTIISYYKDQTKLMKNGRPAAMNLNGILGQLNIKQNGSDVTITSFSLQMRYFVYFSDSDSMYKKQLEVEKEFIDYFQAQQNSLKQDGIELFFNVGRSIDDNIAESSGGDIKFVVISITLMCTFTALVLIRLKDKVGGHYWVGMTGIGCIALGVGSSFGLVMLCGEYYVAFVGVLPFLVLGVGIDDMFIIIDALDRVPSKVRGLERLQIALSEVGASVTMTTITDLVAFAVSASTVFPAIQYFCTYAAVSIFFVYLLIMTLLIAVMTYDISRIENSKVDLLPCKRVTNYDPWKGTHETLSTKIMHRYATILMKTPVRVMVTLLCFSLLGVSLWGATQVEERFDLRQLGTDDSYFIDFLNFRETYFPTDYPVSIINDHTFDYTNERNQDLYRNISKICTESKYFEKNGALNWLDEFLNSPQCNNRLNCTGNNFMPSLHLFLNINPMYYADLKINSSDSTITASRVTCKEKNNADWIWRKDSMLYIRNAVKEYTTIPDLYPIHIDHFYREQILLVQSETIRNLVICAIAVLVITTPYLVHPGIIGLVFFGFVALVFELFALMALWGVALNTISMIVSIMSIGFAVDYSAHVAHAFMLSDAPTPEERIIHAMTDIGSSVLMGGTSTFLGVIVTAFSSSEIFRIFFRMVFGIVVIGLLNGLLFLPVLLTFVCRSKLDIDNDFNFKNTSNDNNTLPNGNLDNRQNEKTIDVDLGNAVVIANPDVVTTVT